MTILQEARRLQLAARLERRCLLAWEIGPGGLAELEEVFAKPASSIEELYGLPIKAVECEGPLSLISIEGPAAD